MSRKKEKKIKRLRKVSIWPQIIEGFLVETTIVAIALFVIATDFFSDKIDLVSTVPKTCLRIINDVQTGWDVNQKALNKNAQTEINNMINYSNETIGGVCIVDDDKNILASFGDTLENDKRFFKYYSKEKFEQNKV